MVSLPPLLTLVPLVTFVSLVPGSLGLAFPEPVNHYQPTTNQPISLSINLPFNPTVGSAGIAKRLQSARPSDQEGEGVLDNSGLTRPAARKPSLPASALPAESIFF